MTIPPDPLAMKAVETAVKTGMELIHEDIKSGLSSIIQTLKERGLAKAKAEENVASFSRALDNDIKQRLSVASDQDTNVRITGNLNDPDFAYLIRQATVASGRTSNQEKHKLLARAVTERLLSKPDSLVALASTLACEIIPNLSPKQLNILGLLQTIIFIRPFYEFDSSSQELVSTYSKVYLSWLNENLQLFHPFPKIGDLGYLHLVSMSCITYDQIIHRPLGPNLIPRNFPDFSWPEDYFEREPLMIELKEVMDEGLAHCLPTTVGQVIGTHVHDIKSASVPTIFQWGEP